MAITPNQYPLLIAAPMLQDYLVDKDTAQALSGGIVTFYQDNARTILKNVYYQTGVPGNYTYIPLPNPNVLTSIGTIADDGGNDTIPFYFPYDEEDDNILQPYYVTVFSANANGFPAVLQFTRENFPFVAPSNVNPDESQQNLINLIANGQFPSHNNLPNNGIFPNGSSSVTVAQGGGAGWYYTKNNTSTDTDVITFTEILQEPDNLAGNPRWAIDIACTLTTKNDTFKQLRYRFNNVNRFASDIQAYTFSFSGVSNSASNVNVFLQVLKNYGTGGSATTTTMIQGYTLTPTVYNQFSTTFVFGLNNIATIGPNNDDYVELCIVLPSTAVFDLDMTDFILTPGMINFSTYPERPDNMVFANAITGSLPIPNPNGSDLYLPIVMTQAGATFDMSVVGQVEGNVGTIPGGNLLACDGTTYLTAGYSSLGIPYSRLNSYLVTIANTGLNIPLYGTGETYATAYITDSITNSIRLTTNQSGAQTGAADGSTMTGFAFGNVHTGQATGFTSYPNGTNSLLAICDAVGMVSLFVNAGTSGFTVSTGSSSASLYYSFTVVTIAASGISAGAFFRYSSPTTQYYVWYKINGAGTDPAPGGTGIQVNLLSTYDAQEVANCTIDAMSGYQVSTIVTNAASTVPAGSFWTFNANSVQYSPWYKVAGAGSAPNVGTPIMITLAGTETAAQVATLTCQAINSVSFGVPDLRGFFLRGLRGNGQFDILANTRASDITGYFGNKPGTFEFINMPLSPSGSSSSNTDVPNSAVTWFIRY
jgi:hypothetical protein